MPAEQQALIKLLSWPATIGMIFMMLVGFAIGAIFGYNL